jgi:hypothetical protein
MAVTRFRAVTHLAVGDGTSTACGHQAQGLHNYTNVPERVTCRLCQKWLRARR